MIRVMTRLTEGRLRRHRQRCIGSVGPHRRAYRMSWISHRKIRGVMDFINSYNPHDRLTFENDLTRAA